MHVFISWDITATGTARWTRINESLRGCLQGYSWVKPLRTVYIVQISGVLDREVLRLALIDVCRRQRGKVSLLISPPLDGGGYSGLLPKRLWPKIRLRTSGDVS